MGSPDDSPVTRLTSSAPDRRAHRRAALDRPALLETRTLSTTARVVDVSCGGIAMRCDLPLGPRERLTVYFELPFGYAIETTAEVARRDGDLLALRFVEAARETVVALRAYCRMHRIMTAA